MQTAESICVVKYNSILIISYAHITKLHMITIYNICISLLAVIKHNINFASYRHQLNIETPINWQSMQPALSNKRTHLAPKQGTMAPNRLANKTSKNSVDSFFLPLFRYPKVLLVFEHPRTTCCRFSCRSDTKGVSFI